MDKELQKIVLQYIKKCKEVCRSQVIGEVSKIKNCERLDTQEAINILLDDKKIMIVGLADTLALTRRGHEALSPWYKIVYYFIRNNFFTIIGLVKK